MSYIVEYYDESNGYYITNEYLAKHATDIELAYEAEANIYPQLFGWIGFNQKGYCTVLAFLISN
jgi:hypothetical protein